MSTQQPERPALGSRENWWFDGGTDDDQAADGDGHDPDTGQSRAEWLAYHILKDTAPALLCPITLHEPPARPGGRREQLAALLFDGEPVDHDPEALHTENGEAEVSEPHVYVPPSARPDDYERTRQYRVTEDFGYLTGPVIKDRPTADFLAVVEIVLSIARQNRGLRQAVAERIRNLARDRKRAGDADVDILTEVIRCIETPGLLDDKGY